MQLISVYHYQWVWFGHCAHKAVFCNPKWGQAETIWEPLVYVEQNSSCLLSIFIVNKKKTKVFPLPTPHPTAEASPQMSTSWSEKSILSLLLFRCSATHDVCFTGSAVGGIMMILHYCKHSVRKRVPNDSDPLSHVLLKWTRFKDLLKRSRSFSNVRLQWIRSISGSFIRLTPAVSSVITQSFIKNSQVLHEIFCHQKNATILPAFLQLVR